MMGKLTMRQIVNETVRDGERMLRDMKEAQTEAKASPSRTKASSRHITKQRRTGIMSDLYNYRIYIKPWYPSYWIEREHTESGRIEVVSNGASGKDVVKRLVLAEIDKMFEPPAHNQPNTKDKETE